MTATGHAQLRDEVQAWLRENWDPERPLLEWRALLADSGWGCPSWPAEYYGRGLDPAAASVAEQELLAHGAVGAPAGAAMTLAAPTILEHGSHELKRRLLRPIITGEHRWCQLFSEPGAGSDLAGLSTRAIADGEDWLVDGQKVWSSGAQKAAYGILLARTDLDVPKHQGITFFALPMRQPGVEVRPIRQMNGYATFNEVFLNGAQVSGAEVVGPVGQGWKVALTTLAHERRAGAGRKTRFPPAESGSTVREARNEAADYYRSYEWYPARMGRADLVVEAAIATGRIADPEIRQEVAHVHTLAKINRWTAQRAQAARRQGRTPGPEGSIAKLQGSVLARTAARVHARIAGADAMLAGPGSALDGLVAQIQLSVPAQSIAGGTDEIQHNIIAERVLGLPRAPLVQRSGSTTAPEPSATTGHRSIPAGLPEASSTSRKDSDRRR